MPPMSFSASLRYPIVKRQLDALRPESVVEVGCGMGAMACRLAAAYEYRGYEPDRRSFETAEHRLDEFGRGEVLNEPLPDAPDRQFDILCAFEVLEHIEDDSMAMKKWVRWIKPGGSVILSVPANPRRFAVGDAAVGHFRRYDKERLTAVMNDAGLAVTGLSAWGMPIGYLIEGTRNMILAAGKETGPIEERTAKSGRLYQPIGRVTGRFRELAMRPFTIAQRPFVNTDLGIGYVAVGRLDR